MYVYGTYGIFKVAMLSLNTLIILFTILSSNGLAYEANCKFTSGSASGNSFHIKVSGKRMIMKASYGTFMSFYTGSVYSNGEKFFCYNDIEEQPYNEICFGTFRSDGTFSVHGEGGSGICRKLK